MTTTKAITNTHLSFCTLLVLYMIYGVNYNFLLGIPTSYISLAVMILYASLYSILQKRFTLKFRTAIVFSIILCLISTLSLSLNLGTIDLFLLRSSFIYLTICFFFFPIYESIFKSSHLLLLKSIGYAGLINALFIISMLIIKPFQMSYLSLINLDTLKLMKGDGILDGLMSLRMIGITGFSAYSTSFVQMLCAICFLLYVFYKKNRKLELNLRESLILIFIILSAVISARSAFLGILVFLLILMKISTIKEFTKFISLSLFLIVIFIITIISFVPTEFKDFFIRWITELFVSGTNTGSFQTNVKMFKFSLADFSLLGDSRWFGDNNDYYMNIDVGWYRILFSIGYIGLFFWILTILSIVGWKHILPPWLTPEKWTAALILLYIFVMNFKGAILLDSFQSLFILLSINTALTNKKLNL